MVDNNIEQLQKSVSELKVDAANYLLVEADVSLKEDVERSIS